MKLRFDMQILIGTRCYGVGEVAELDDVKSADLIHRGVASEYVQPAPAVREAVSQEPQRARKAVSRG